MVCKGTILCGEQLFCTSQKVSFLFKIVHFDRCRMTVGTVMTVLFKNSSRTRACVRTHEKSLKSTVITVTTVTLPQEATTRLRGKTWTFEPSNMDF